MCCYIEKVGLEKQFIIALVYSSEIMDAVEAKLGEKNWKVRKKGLDAVIEILNKAKFINANVGDLPGALKTRLSDSNKILINTNFSGRFNYIVIYLILRIFFSFCSTVLINYCSRGAHCTVLRVNVKVV